MAEPPEIRFDDGAAYERMMGNWSRRAGTVFLDWLAPPSGLRWIDVGCGNGAFSGLVFDRAAPSHLVGIDPSQAQIDYARTRLGDRAAEFLIGDAVPLPMPDAGFDIAVMALVIFFVPDPGKAVAEMARVVRPGGVVASYSWDVLGGGMPMEPTLRELRALGLTPPLPPRAGVSDIESLKGFWRQAGLTEIESREIAVERRFTDFAEFWSVHQAGPMARTFASLSRDQTAALEAALRHGLSFDADGGILCQARAHAIRGRVPD